jgi:hypothetical protein
MLSIAVGLIIIFFSIRYFILAGIRKIHDINRENKPLYDTKDYIKEKHQLTAKPSNKQGKIRVEKEFEVEDVDYI